MTHYLHNISKKRLAVSLLVVGVLALIAASGAQADIFTPEDGGSPNADRIDSLYKIVMAIALVIFIGVEGLLIYSAIKFHSKRNKVATQTHGNNKLEIGWTVGATVIVFALGVITFMKLGPIKDAEPSNLSGLASVASSPAELKIGGGDRPLGGEFPGDKPPGEGSQERTSLEIEVVGLQYLWRYTYPNRATAYEEMVVPIDTTVELIIKAQDVMHSWWIPKLGGKFDAVPGYTNRTWFKISKPGVYQGQCAELCGRNHANMFARVRAVPVQQYRAWVANQKREIDLAAKLSAQQRNRLQATDRAAAAAAAANQQ